MLTFMQMRYAIQFRLDEIRHVVASYRIVPHRNGIALSLARWVNVCTFEDPAGRQQFNFLKCIHRNLACNKNLEFNLLKTLR